MKKSIPALRAVAAIAIAILSTSCILNAEGIRGSGNVVEQKRNVGENFSGIVVDSGIDVEVSQGNGTSVIVKADDNVQKHITTRVENGVLYISSDHKNFINVEARKVIVRMPDITRLETSGGANLSSQGVIVSNDLDIKAASGSEMSVSVEAEKLLCEAESGSTATIRGKAIHAETSSASGSSLDASNLMANEVDAQAASGSSTDVRAIVRLAAKASSGSSIDYHGSPKKIAVEESSGGSVSPN